MPNRLNYQRKPGRPRRAPVLLGAVTAMVITGFAYRNDYLPPLKLWLTIRREEYLCCHYTMDPAVPAHKAPAVFLSFIKHVDPEEFIYIDDRLDGDIPLRQVFLHERTSKNGRSRLVFCQCAFLSGIPGRPPGKLAVDVKTMDLKTHHMDFTWSYSILINYSAKNIVYGGRADPNDPSHFEFKYEQDGGSGFVDAYLSDEQYKPIKLKVRDGPAADLQWQLDGPP